MMQQVSIPPPWTKVSLACCDARLLCFSLAWTAHYCKTINNFQWTPINMGSEHLWANELIRIHKWTNQRGEQDTPEPITGPNTETGIKLVSWSLVISIASQYKLGLGGQRAKPRLDAIDSLTARHSILYTAWQNSSGKS